MTLPTQGERIASLETQVSLMRAEQISTNDKLDALLALRNKGLGAFWLATSLLGTGIVGFLAAIFDWFKPHVG